MSEKKTDTQLRKKLGELNTYSEFIILLNEFGLKINDLSEFGTIRPFQLKAVKKAFKGRETDKEYWSGFKKSYTQHYALIHAPTIVAFSNKN